ETVKKSRIVSDDDLEESLMQEFNIRLKHCMSQEQTQEPSDDEEDKEHVKEMIKVEFNSVTTNGNQEDSIYDEVNPINSNERFLYEERCVYSESNGLPLKNGLSQEVHDKIREQEEALRDLEEETPAKTIQKVEVIYDEVKNVRPVLQLPTTCLTDMSDSTEQDSQEMNKSSVKDRMLLSTDDTSCLLFTQTVTSPMLTPSEENIDFLKGFQRQSSQNTTSTSENTNSENVQSSKIDDIEQVEDATESSNISDKLDVEYENVQQANTDNDVSEVEYLVPISVENPQIQIDEEVDDKMQGENIYEVIEDDVDEKQEEIYENMEILRKQSIEYLTDKQRSTREFLEREIMEEDKIRGEDNIYENIEDTEEEDIELSNAESIEEIQHDDAPEKSIPDVCLEANEKLNHQQSSQQSEFEIVDQVKSPIEIENEEIKEFQSSTPQEHTTPEIIQEHRHLYTEIDHTSPSSKSPELAEPLESQTVRQTKHSSIDLEEINVTDSEIEDKSIDNPSKMVDALKSKFLTTTATVEVVKTTSIEESELSQLKAVDIMKQIHKFENKSPGKEDEEVDEDTNSSV
ncbi:hypothetical protein AMK59_1711, partial [Oryctes borbonicus]